MGIGAIDGGGAIGKVHHRGGNRECYRRRRHHAQVVTMFDGNVVTVAAQTAKGQGRDAIDADHIAIGLE